MKRKDFLKELQGLSKEDLTIKAKTVAEELMRLRFRRASGQLEQAHRLRSLRRDLARVQTFISRASISKAETNSVKKNSAAQ